MIDTLAGRINAIVAIHAIAGDIQVVKIRWQPGDRGVAVIASITAGDMCGVLAGRCDAVVTGTAGSNHMHVIDSIRGRECAGVVAIFTDITCLNVSQALACRIGTVMAATAVAGNVRVVEIRRQPADGRVAVVAVIAARNVCRVFAGGCHAIMTGPAGPDYLCVIHREHWCPHVGRMAIFTDITGLNVRCILTGGIGAVVAGDTIASDIQMIKICW